MWSGSIRVIISHLHSNLRHQPFHGWTQNQCLRDLLACFCHHSWNVEPDQGESKPPKHWFLVQPHCPWQWRQSKPLKMRSEVLKALQTFKTSIPIYQSSWYNIPKDMNQIAKTLVFGSTYQPCLRIWCSSPKQWFLTQTCHRELSKQTCVHLFTINASNPTWTIFLISQKMYITYMYGASQQLAKPWKNLFKSHGDTKHIYIKKISMSGNIKILEYKLNYI